MCVHGSGRRDLKGRELVRFLIIKKIKMNVRVFKNWIGPAGSTGLTMTGHQSGFKT